MITFFEPTSLAIWMISRDVVPRTIESAGGGKSASGPDRESRVRLTVDDQHVLACEFERHGVQLPSHAFLSGKPRSV